MARTTMHALLTGLFLLCNLGNLQAQEKCTAPPIPPTPPGLNIFSEQQEVDLGEIMAEQVERNYRVIHDEELAAHLNRTAGRILSQLPPTQLKIRVVLVDLPIVNAFSLPGGKIYVARKMVAFLHSDDELAGLLGHEMGHILTHQGAIRMTRLFREVMGVTSVADRKDIFDKFNKLLDNTHRNPKAFKPDAGEEEPHQYQADQVALISVSNAGYSTQAFVDFFDRLVQTKGKTGSFISDLFGTTKPNEKRLREMHKSQEALPAVCRKNPAPPASKEFLAWQLDVIGYSGLGREDSLVGLVEKKDLEPPLRSDIAQLQFSPDGEYILAQDDSSIFVLTRDPLESQFRIDAPEADHARFTPDSQALVFSIHGTHVEKWNLAEEERTGVTEVSVPGGCVQTKLSPDGDILACLNSKFDLALYEVSSGKSLFSKSAYFQPADPFGWGIGRWVLFAEEYWQFSWVHMEFSPDSRYFIAQNNEKHILLDMATYGAVAMHGGLADMTSGGFAFLSSDRAIVGSRTDTRKSAIVEFPSGKILKWMLVSADRFRGVSHGDYAIFSPVKGAAAGAVDLATQQVFTGPLKTGALDVYDGHLLAEKTSGEIGIFDLTTHKMEAKAALPRSPLRYLRTWAVSPDLMWLAVSGTTRGAVWNIPAAKRFYFTRGFRGAYFDKDRVLYADFPKIEGQERSIAMFDLTSVNIGAGVPVNDDASTFQMGVYLITRKRLDKSGSWRKNIALEVQDVRDGKRLWTRDFPNDAPAIQSSSATSNLALIWGTAQSGAKDEIKSDPALQTRFAAMENHEGAYLLEFLEGATGKILGKVLVETGKGSFHIRGATATGDWVLLTDDENRTLVYSLTFGDRKATLFGSHAMVSTPAQLLVVGNEAGEMDVYSLPAIEKRSHLTFSSPISIVSFNSDGKRLLVVTANQTAYIFDTAVLSRAEAKTSAKAQ